MDRARAYKSWGNTHVLRRPEPYLPKRHAQKCWKRLKYGRDAFEPSPCLFVHLTNIASFSFQIRNVSMYRNVNIAPMTINCAPTSLIRISLENTYYIASLISTQWCRGAIDKPVRQTHTSCT